MLVNASLKCVRVSECIGLVFNRLRDSNPLIRLQVVNLTCLVLGCTIVHPSSAFGLLSAFSNTHDNYEEAKTKNI